MMTGKQNVVLYLMGKKGQSTLSALIAAGHADSILAVVTAKDQGVENDYFQEIQDLAKQAKMTVFARGTEFETQKLRADYGLAIGWRWIINEANHERIIVLHDSLLPRFRGFAPLVAQLLKGETTIGVTAIIASKEYDKGPIIFQESVDIQYPIKIKTAIEKITPLYERLSLRALDLIIGGTEPEGRVQDESLATYSIWRDDEDLRIDWKQSSDYISRFVNATGFPYKGAFAFLEGKRVVVLDVEPVDDINLEFRHVGKVVYFNDGCPVVICGKGLVKILMAKWDESGESINRWPNFRMRFK